MGISFSDVITSDLGLKPGIQTTVLALNETQKEKLVSFWEKYRDLILWAVDEKNRNADKENIEESNKRLYYTKGDGQGYSMSRMVQAVISEWGSLHTYDEIVDTFSIRQKANTNNIIKEVNRANSDYYFMDQIIETRDKKNVSYTNYGVSQNLTCSSKRLRMSPYALNSSSLSHYQKMNQRY